MITRTDITVWTVSALLAIGIGWSRYAKWKTRDKLVRELAAMDPERREKMLSRLDPKTAMEARQQLLQRFRIMT
jgi:tRNA A37 N6-isopentenylltransferase MiaA